MALYHVRVAPFHNEVFTITSVWWEEPRNHRGLDITTGVNSALFPIAKSEVVFSGAERDPLGNLTGYGYYIITKDVNTNMGYLYAHLRDNPLYPVGAIVDTNQIIGYEGSTGDSTGIHLHFEMQDLTNHDWVYGAPREYYTNPADFMGIPNVEGEQGIYDYSPTPHPNKFSQTHFPWVLYARKIRGE